MQSTGVADDAFSMIQNLSPATRLLQSLPRSLLTSFATFNFPSQCQPH
jgi:hypothetical protein